MGEREGEARPGLSRWALALAAYSLGLGIFAIVSLSPRFSPLGYVFCAGSVGMWGLFLESAGRRRESARLVRVGLALAFAGACVSAFLLAYALWSLLRPYP